MTSTVSRTRQRVIRPVAVYVQILPYTNFNRNTVTWNFKCSRSFIAVINKRCFSNDNFTTNQKSAWTYCITYNWDLNSDNTFRVTHSLTPWRSPSWEANRSSAVKKFSAFYGTRRFITAFTRVSYLSLSWVRSIQSMPPNSNYWRTILMLSSHLHLGLPSGFLPSSFPTKILYAPLQTIAVQLKIINSKL